MTSLRNKVVYSTVVYSTGTLISLTRFLGEKMSSEL